MPCANHPQVTTDLAHCEACAQTFCEECRVELDGRPVCASCKAEALAHAVPPPRKPGIPEGNVPPWEQGSALGWWTAFWRTVSEVMMRPTAFFTTMEKKSATWTWLWIPAITHTAAAITNNIASMLFMAGLMKWMQTQAGGGGAPGAMLGMQGVTSVLGIVLAPVSALVATFVWAGCIHLWLIVFKQARLPFAQTARGVSYSYAAYVVAVIPFLGQIIGAIWCTVANYKMVRSLHGAGPWHAFFAVTWLGLLCCSGYVVFIGGMFALMHNR